MHTIVQYFLRRRGRGRRWSRRTKTLWHRSLRGRAQRNDQAKASAAAGAVVALFPRKVVIQRWWLGQQQPWKQQWRRRARAEGMEAFGFCRIGGDDGRTLQGQSGRWHQRPARSLQVRLARLRSDGPNLGPGGNTRQNLVGFGLGLEQAGRDGLAW